MKAIKKLYADKSNSISGSQYNNQENRLNQSNCSFGENSSGFKRKRKFNDMSCDMEISPNFEENRPLESKSSMEVTKSPTSQKNSIVDEEEKEKEINNSENEDQLKYYSTKLLEILKSTSSESEALQFINCCLIEYKSKSDTQPNIQIRGEIKQKYSDKDKKIFVDAFKKLASDNVLLKSSILKLVEKKDKNKAKAEKFDQLLQEYEKVISENEKLKKSVDILKYAAKDTIIFSLNLNWIFNQSLIFV